MSDGNWKDEYNDAVVGDYLAMLAKKGPTYALLNARDHERCHSSSNRGSFDRLEAALTTADTTRARLLEALLHEALDPTADAVAEAAE